jgi:plastocyanin
MKRSRSPWFSTERITAMRPLFISCAAVACLLTVQATGAATISATVADASGKPLNDAVVYAEPVGTAPGMKPNPNAEIAQKGRKFLPMVSVVQVGTNIMFPNNDVFRHHVYSFSPAKVFELKLYSGIPGSPVNFDKAGTVVLGCNIHDRMLAYIHVVNTPYFAKTDATGAARIEGVAPGKYQLKAWHYSLPPAAAVAEQPLVLTSADAGAAFVLPTRPATSAD